MKNGSSAVLTPEQNQAIRTLLPLHRVLAAALPGLHDSCRDPWVVIGSAAAWLMGAHVSVADLDVLTSLRDADTLRDRWQMQHEVTYQPVDSARFRSRFSRYRFPGLPVEVMGGLEVFGADGWKPLQISRIVNLSIAESTVPVPTVAEQIRVLACFGRPKDRTRIAALQTLHGDNA